LFVQGANLQMIVHDARFDFYDKYRGTNTEPRFTSGSRNSASGADVQGAGLASPRPDWLSIPLNSLMSVAGAPQAPAAPATVAAPAPAAPAQVQPGAAAVVAAPPAAAVAPAPRRPLDAAGADDIERRLETLKRLRDRNLITEEEYQQKRKEILQAL
jgi:hypothetical protein